MLKIIAAGALALPVVAAAGVAATGVVVVDVREGGGGQRIVVPVPLVLAQAAAAFVPSQRTRIPLHGDAARYLPVARQALQALADAEDGEIVSVEEPGTKVSIRKEGDLLRIKVSERDEDVTVNVPISLALSVLPDSGGSITASQAIWSLQRARLTQVVDVQGKDGERVKVTVY